MKRNKQSSRAMRNQTTANIQARGDSKYARKVKSGKQMYGKRGRYVAELPEDDLKNSG